MIVLLILGIVLFMILGFNSIDRIGRDVHNDSRKGSYYEISNRKGE